MVSGFDVPKKTNPVEEIVVEMGPGDFYWK